MLARFNLAEPAEPFSKHSKQTCNYKIKMRKPVGGKFRGFRYKAFLQSLLKEVPLVPLYLHSTATKDGLA